jgi:hypothetical protein
VILQTTGGFTPIASTEYILRIRGLDIGF